MNKPKKLWVGVSVFLILGSILVITTLAMNDLAKQGEIRPRTDDSQPKIVNPNGVLDPVQKRFHPNRKGLNENPIGY